MYWEIASIILQVIQMGYYLSALDKYKDKLEDLADWLKDKADANRVHYEHFRAMDLDFYNYYTSGSGYAVCESNVHRAKGGAFSDYGRRLRRGLTSIRGYSQLSRVHLNNMQANRAINITAVQRASTVIVERKRVDQHTLERWSMIARAPVGVEQYKPAYTNAIISSSFKSFKAAAHGFNSAGAAFGNSLYKILH